MCRAAIEKSVCLTRTRTNTNNNRHNRENWLASLRLTRCLTCCYSGGVGRPLSLLLLGVIQLMSTSMLMLDNM